MLYHGLIGFSCLSGFRDFIGSISDIILYNSIRLYILDEIRLVRFSDSFFLIERTIF